MPITLALTKVFTLASLAFFVALIITPAFTKFLYKYKLGKNISRGSDAPIFNKLHAAKQGTPIMGGILVWGTVTFLAASFWFLDRVVGVEFFHKINFLTRKETLLPLGAFIGAALVGLADDLMDIYRMGHKQKGLPFRIKVFLYGFVAAIGAWWFYYKLEFNSVHIPFLGNIELGWLYIPFFILTVVATSFAVNQTDGEDGLAGGTLLIALFAYGLIAFAQGKDNLAGLLAATCGGLLAFLWFNVHPAKFFMGDTGSMGLGILLAIVAFLTNAPILLLIIGSVFVLEATSTIIQITSKRLRGKKVFLSAPIHHHLEALGWPETRITMRFWIISAVSSFVGLIIYFLGR